MDEQQQLQERLRRVARVLYASGEVDLALLIVVPQPITENENGRV